MFTSDNNDALKEKLNMTRISFAYLWAACFCLLFGAVYEYFSHEVYSYYMLYAFCFPLVGGVLPFLALSLTSRRKLPGHTARQLYHCGVATLTVGSLLTGILEIYGTTNDLTKVYWYVGGGLLVAAVGGYGSSLFKT